MLDGYALRARVAPAAILIAPFGALIAVVDLPPLGAGGLAIGTMTAWSLVAAGFVGDRGRRLQRALFRRWGGSPTVRRLRSPEDEGAALRRGDLSRITGVALPSAVEGRASDEIYERAIEIARATLRENDQHKVLADANAEFGFRRNCLGIRSEGIAVAVVCAALGVGLWAASVGPQPGGFLAAGLVSVGIGVFWRFWVREAWVRSAAERYGDQFFQTLHTYRSPIPGLGQSPQQAQEGR